MLRYREFIDKVIKLFSDNKIKNPNLFKLRKIMKKYTDEAGKTAESSEEKFNLAYDISKTKINEIIKTYNKLISE